MDCYPIDDYCKLFNEAFEVKAEDKFGEVTEIGVFNGRRYSFSKYGDSPAIIIEDVVGARDDGSSEILLDEGR